MKTNLLHLPDIKCPYEYTLALARTYVMLFNATQEVSYLKAARCCALKAQRLHALELENMTVTHWNIAPFKESA